MSAVVHFGPFLGPCPAHWALQFHKGRRREATELVEKRKGSFAKEKGGCNPMDAPGILGIRKWEMEISLNGADF